MKFDQQPLRQVDILERLTQNSQSPSPVENEIIPVIPLSTDQKSTPPDVKKSNGIANKSSVLNSKPVNTTNKKRGFQQISSNNAKSDSKKPKKANTK